MQFRICRTCFELGFHCYTGYQFREFRRPKIDVAQALYQAIFKFDETEPRFVKIVQIIYLDRDVSDLINREFSWRFGGVSEMCVFTEGRT